MRKIGLLIVLIVAGAAGCTKPAPAPKATFSDVCVAVEPQLGRIRLPSVTDHAFKAQLEVAGNDDFFQVLDVTVEDKGADREFGLTVMYSIGGKQKGLAQKVTYSDLPMKYLEAGKWTVWVQREAQPE